MLRGARGCSLSAVALWTLGTWKETGGWGGVSGLVRYQAQQVSWAWGPGVRESSMWGLVGAGPSWGVVAISTGPGPRAAWEGGWAVGSCMKEAGQGLASLFLSSPFCGSMLLGARYGYCRVCGPGGSAKTLPAEGGGTWSDGHFRMTQGKVGQGSCRPRGATENSLRPCGKGGQEA